jgi:hypothetical protein
MARYEDYPGGIYRDPATAESAPPTPAQTTLFHGGLTPIKTLPDGKRVYQAGDGTTWTDDPNMNSVTGFIPYAAKAGGEGGVDTGGGVVAPPAGGGGDVWSQPAPLDVGGGVKGLPYLPATPEFTAPKFEKPPAFSYADFVNPTAADVYNDPGFQFRRDEGANALLRSKAAQGTLNTGGALSDFLKLNQSFANQEYGSVWDRAANAYSMNRQNALSNYNTNYGTQTKDPYQFNYQASLDEFAPKMAAYGIQAQAGQRANELNQSYSWQRWLEDERRRQQGFQNQFQIASA